MNTPKLLIVGLDSATLDLINPWIQQGLLPNLARLVQGGVSGALQSAIPPLTPPAWTSFMTGKNPGKHGVFYFLEPQPGSYAMRYVNAGSRRARTFFRALSDAGVTVGAMNIPFTFPPEELKNGFQISGMDTPSSKSPFIYPASLRTELEDVVGKISFDITHLGFMNTEERRADVLDEMRRIDEQWMAIGLHLLEKHPADVMMFTFMSIDTVQHHFWQYMDPNHFLHDPVAAKRFGSAVQEVYQRLDAAVGKFVERVPKDTTVVVVSDHGGGPTSDRVVYLNRFLAQHGLLKYRAQKSSALKRLKQGVQRAVYSLLQGSLGPAQKKFLSGLLPGMREKFEGAYTSFADIDWTGTKAYCSEVLASPPSIWINRVGEKPSGIVKDEEYESLLAFITEKIAEMKDPRTGKAVIPRVYRRNEIFQGPYAGEAPDLVLDWWGEEGFSISPSFPEDSAKPPLEIREHAPMKEPEWGGTHRLQGILVTQGPALKTGVQIEGARLMDMAPTLLYLMGQKVPADMDGRVLLDMFDPEFVRQHPVEYEAASNDPAGPAGAQYSAEEAGQVEERLKALGYIE